MPRAKLEKSETAKAAVESVKPTKAKNRPAIRSRSIDATEQPLGYTERKSKPDARTAKERVGEPRMVQVADRMPDPEKLAMLAFMNEEVEVQIGNTNDKNAVPFEITVNGHTEIFRYGDTKRVKRYIVDRMALLRTTSYETPEKVNQLGERYTDRVPTTALTYPFQVTDDPNPKGRDWLRATLAMPG
jgi:hypothetical protein